MHPIKYKEIPKYPPIIEDLSFVVPQKTYVGEIIRIINKTDPIIEKIELIDSFDKNRTFRITYQDSKKTLTDKEVEKIREKIIKNLKSKLKLELKTKKSN